MLIFDAGTIARFGAVRAARVTGRKPDGEKTHRDHVADALAHEGALRWSAASKSWAAAAKSYAGGKRVDAVAEGTILQHVSRGEVKAECAREAGGYRYAGEIYPSLSAAATAAARALGMKGRVSGRLFWGAVDRSAINREQHQARLGRV